LSVRLRKEGGKKGGGRGENKRTGRHGGFKSHFHLPLARGGKWHIVWGEERRRGEKREGKEKGREKIRERGDEELCSSHPSLRPPALRTRERRREKERRKKKKRKVGGGKGARKLECKTLLSSPSLLPFFRGARAVTWERGKEKKESEPSSQLAV